MKIGNVVKYLFHPKMLIWRLRYIRKSALEIAALKTMKYDCNRFLMFAGVFHPDTKSNLEARIIHTYHGIEKGLTMPKRRYNFGHDNILSLVKLIEEFIATYGTPQGQVEHGIGILKAYLDMHKNFDGKSDEEFWKSIHTLTDRFPDIKTAAQPHKTYSEFYKDVDSNFEKFAKSRHTLRHYGGSVSEDEIKQAVTLAMTAPSACNRQPVRVHCVCEKTLKDKVLELQSGNRGFGKDADKVLIVTGDLSSVCWVDERYDVYTNCGIFIMNLCYSLFYYKIAHCVLNWSICVDSEKDALLHKLVGIPDNEVVAALISCGKTPQEFDIAESPRKSVEEILSYHR